MSIHGTTNIWSVDYKYSISMKKPNLPILFLIIQSAHFLPHNPGLVSVTEREREGMFGRGGIMCLSHKFVAQQRTKLEHYITHCQQAIPSRFLSHIWRHEDLTKKRCNKIPLGEVGLGRQTQEGDHCLQGSLYLLIWIRKVNQGITMAEYTCHNLWAWLTKPHMEEGILWIEYMHPPS